MAVGFVRNFTASDGAWSNNPNTPNLSESDLKCRSLQQRWGLVAVTCPPQVHHLIYVLHCLQIGPAICQAPNVLTKYSKCLSTCNDHAFVVQARGVYQHT